MSRSPRISATALRKTALGALAGFLILGAVGGSALATDDKPRYGFGRTPMAEEIAGWDIDVRGADGLGLPPGEGTVAQGEELYLERCAACHGDWGEGAGRYPVLMGGGGTLKSHDPIKTIGSYWPFAPTLFDYIRRAMPFGAGQSLTAEETYAITAYVLYLNELVPEDAVMNAKTLPAVKMPNRANFFMDPRPDVRGEACMKNCRKEPPKITSEAKNLDVTPPLE